jgi:hypothetical protein
MLLEPVVKRRPPHPSELERRVRSNLDVQHVEDCDPKDPYPSLYITSITTLVPSSRRGLSMT